MRTCFIILLSLVSVQVCAQSSIGVKSGLSIPSLHGNKEKNKMNTWREAMYGGVFIDFKLNRLFYLQPELNYSPQGGERNGIQEVPANYVNGIELPPGTPLYAYFNSRTILNYLEIPVLVKMVVDRELTYSVCVGPYISFLLSAKTKVRGNSKLYLDKNGEIPFVPDGEPIPFLSFDRNTDIMKSTTKIGGGIQGGVGVGYPLWAGHLFFDTRVFVGLTNVHIGAIRDGKNRTGSLVMTVGYQFDFR